jgi:RNA polymerase sigma-70 factor (ECF subfamily)
LNSEASATSRDELLPDEQLVSRALGGDRGAFNQLVVRHERRLFRFLSRSASNAADIEDAMQQAMIKAYLNLARYDSRWRFTTWLFTIALRELRALGRRPATAALQAGDEPAAAPVEHPIDNDDPGDLWRAARRLLNPQPFTALWLRYGEDLPVRDVARVMRRPRIWVSVTLHRACALLRMTLSPAPGGGTGHARETAPPTDSMHRTIRGVL